MILNFKFPIKLGGFPEKDVWIKLENREKSPFLGSFEGCDDSPKRILELIKVEQKVSGKMEIGVR